MIVLNVGEVAVDEAGVVDEVRDALNGVQENFVGLLERVEHRERRARDREQALVRDRDERVDVLAQPGHALLGMLHALLAFEHEGLGHDADGERADFLRDLREDGRGAGSGAAAHAGGDEDHVRAGEDLGDLGVVLESGLAADLRVGAGAEALGQLLADRELRRSQRGVERLPIGVGRDELDAVEAHPDHRVDGVAAAAADADHLDLCSLSRCLIDFEH